MASCPHQSEAGGKIGRPAGQPASTAHMPVQTGGNPPASSTDHGKTHIALPIHFIFLRQRRAAAPGIAWRATATQAPALVPAPRIHTHPCFGKRCFAPLLHNFVPFVLHP